MENVLPPKYPQQKLQWKMLFPLNSLEKNYNGKCCSPYPQKKLQWKILFLINTLKKIAVENVVPHKYPQQKLQWKMLFPINSLNINYNSRGSSAKAMWPSIGRCVTVKTRSAGSESASVEERNSVVILRADPSITAISLLASTSGGMRSSVTRKTSTTTI